MAAIGDFYQGGYVFYIDSSTNTAYICSPINNNGYAHADEEGAIDTSITTNTDIGSGATNTSLLSDVSPVAGAAGRTTFNGLDDWYLPSIDTLEVLWDNIGLNPAIEGTPNYNLAGFSAGDTFWSSSLYNNTSTSGWGNTINSNYGFSVAESLTNSYKSILVRTNTNDAGLISVYDSDETLVFTDGIIHFGHLNLPFTGVSQTIPIKVRGNGTQLVSFFIDMTNVGDGFSNTAEDIFGSLSRIESVSNYDTSAIWYSNPSLSSNLTTLSNSTAYLLSFSGSSEGSVYLEGEPLSTPVTVTIPSGSSWLPIPVDGVFSLSDTDFFPIESQTLTTSIVDTSTGDSWPLVHGRGLKQLISGKGYEILTTGSFDFKFNEPRSQSPNSIAASSGGSSNGGIYDDPTATGRMKMIIPGVILERLINESEVHSGIVALQHSLIDTFRQGDAAIEAFYQARGYDMTHATLMATDSTYSSDAIYDRGDYQAQYNLKYSLFNSIDLKYTIKFKDPNNLTIGELSSFTSNFIRDKNAYICTVSNSSNHRLPYIHVVVENGEKVSKFMISSRHRIFTSDRYLNNPNVGAGEFINPLYKTEEFLLQDVLFTDSFSI